MVFFTYSPGRFRPLQQELVPTILANDFVFEVVAALLPGGLTPGPGDGNTRRVGCRDSGGYAQRGFSFSSCTGARLPP